MPCRDVLIILGFEKKGATPLPWARLSVCVIALMASAFNITFLFPFLPQMVLEFGYAEEEKGYYIGLIASAFFVGRAVGGNIWGYASDKLGRRPMLILSLLLSGITAVIFGCSTSVEMAIGTRFLTGFVNGMVGLVKTVIYELSDDSNQGMAMCTVSLAWGSGIVLAPLLGGYLSLPARKYSSVFPSEGLWVQFPFILPCFVSSAVCFIAMGIVFFYLPETNADRKSKPEAGKEDPSTQSLKKTSFMDMEGPDIIQSTSNMAMYRSYDDVTLPSHKSASLSRPSQTNRKFSISVPDIRLLERGEKFRFKGQNSVPEESHPDECSESLEQTCDDEVHVRKTVWTRCCDMVFFKLLRSRDVAMALSLYTLSSFSVIGFEEVFVIFASTDVSYGGLSFDTNQLGAATGLMSIPLLTLQLFIFPRLESRFGAKRTTIMCSVVMMVLIIITPLARVLVDRTVELWVLLFAILAPLRMMVTSVFTAQSMMVNNSVEPCHAGTVNGMSVLFAASARSLAPIFGGSGFAWSITNNLPFPFDVNFTFVVFSLVVLISTCTGVFLPEHLDKQKKRQNKVELTSAPPSHAKAKLLSGSGNGDTDS